MIATLTERDSANLESALAELRKIEDRRREIVDNDGAKLRELRTLQNEAQSAAARCNAALNDDTSGSEFREILRVWAATYPTIVPLGLMVQAQSRSASTDPGRVGKLKSLIGDLKGPLIKVCQLRIAQAQASLENLTSQEQERLGPEYDAADSPPVKRRAHRVEHFKLMLRRITEQRIEDVWVNFCSQLLGEYDNAIGNR